MTDRYRDATALRRALEVRLKQQATDTVTDLARRRRLVVFDRIAVRLSAGPAAGWVLKGGAVMEFRLRDRARTTKDMDLAEKLHALTRDYGDRPNTRVKDLVDLVLLVESGLVADAAMTDAIRHVFAVRATHEVPEVLPDPPPVWVGTYPELADGLTETPPRLDVALNLVRDFWAKASQNGEAEPK